MNAWVFECEGEMILTKLYHKFKRKLFPVKVYSDPFIEWLEYYNAGMVDKGNTYALQYVIQHTNSTSPICEIGAFCGFSANLTCYFLRKYNKPNLFFSVDAFDYDPFKSMKTIGDSSLKYIDFNPKIKNVYLENLKVFSAENLPFAIEAFSDDFFNAWRSNAKQKDLFSKNVQLGGPICFAYIDGDHSYEGAKKDFINCDEFLEVGGFILFDDSSDESKWEVKRVIQDVKDSGRYTVVMKNPNYLFKKTR